MPAEHEPAGPQRGMPADLTRAPVGTRARNVLPDSEGAGTVRGRSGAGRTKDLAPLASRPSTHRAPRNLDPATRPALRSTGTAPATTGPTDTLTGKGQFHAYTCILLLRRYISYTPSLRDTKGHHAPFDQLAKRHLPRAPVARSALLFFSSLVSRAHRLRTVCLILLRLDSSFTWYWLLPCALFDACAMPPTLLSVPLLSLTVTVASSA